MKKIEVVQESCFYDDPCEGNSSDSVTMKVTQDDGTVNTKSMDVREGESEDMIFGRNLSDLCSVMSMIELAYEAGKQGIELEINYINELEDEED